MKMLVLIFFILSGLLITSEGAQLYESQRYRGFESSETMHIRLLDLSRIIYHDAGERIRATNPQRFMYEASPFYEQGYVFAEILERYKRMVMQMKRMHHINNALYDIIDKAEKVQKLNFEINHLVKMMHEIPVKYKYDKGFELETQKTDEEKDDEDFKEYQKIEREYNEAEDWKKEVVANRHKQLKERQKLISAGVITTKQEHPPPGGRKEPYNTQWPRDYGWEIEEIE